MTAGDRDERDAPPGRPRSRQFALRLLNRTSDSRGTDLPGHTSRAACENLYWELSRWIGFDGCHALFTRAIAQARIEHPSLGAIALCLRSDPYIEGVQESIASHGDAPVAAGLESMLVGVVDLLGRIIGEDMAGRLIEQSMAATGSHQNARGVAPTRES